MQRTLDFYNLDAIISVGYRIKSRVATQFRIWATQRLREYIRVIAGAFGVKKGDSGCPSGEGTPACESHPTEIGQRDGTGAA